MSQLPRASRRARRASAPEVSVEERIAGASLDLATVYRDNAQAVSRWARRLLGPSGDVEDVVHEVFLVVHRKLPAFRGDAKISTWLYAITVRVVQDRRKKGRWWRFLPLVGDGPGEPAARGTPLQDLETRRSIELTYELLDGLSERDRTALILFELEGLSGEAIAAVTGDSIGSVWVRVHRARRRFREAFLRWEEKRLANGRPGEDER